MPRTRQRPLGSIKKVNTPYVLPINDFTLDTRYNKSYIYKLFHRDYPNIMYIGSTLDILSREFGHLQFPVNRFVKDHFNTNGWKGLSIECIQECYCWNRDQLEDIEYEWISKLNPKLNYKMQKHSKASPVNFQVLQDEFNRTFWQSFIST
jgi:hypothetical protein